VVQLLPYQPFAGQFLDTDIYYVAHAGNMVCAHFIRALVAADRA
jgi:hypothetical protein